MPTEAGIVRTYLIGALLICSLTATIVAAEPPRTDSLKMRSISRPTAPAVVAPTTPQPASNAVAPATVDKSVKQATEVLELCYSIARRSDASLATPLTVQATVRADGSTQLHAPAGSTGAGYFARCVERKLSALVLVDQLPALDASTRVITLGAAK